MWLQRKSPVDNVFTPRSRPGTWLARLYVLRVPILMALILLVFPFIALTEGWLGAKPLFQNFFVLDQVGTFLVTFTTLLLAWSIALNALVVLFNSEERFGLSPSLTQATLIRHARAVRWGFAGFAVAIATPMTLGQFVQRDWTPLWANFAGVLAGFLAAYVVAFLALLSAVWVQAHAISCAIDVFPAPQFLRNRLKRAHEHRLFERLWQRLRQGLEKIPEDFAAGYIDRRKTIENRDNPGRGLPWSGVWLTLFFAVATLVVFYSIGVYKQYRLNASDPAAIPALGFVLLLLLKANWILGFTAFLLDRFRIPLLIPLAALAILAVATPWSDHYYKLTPRPDGLRRILPYQALEKRVDERRPIIIVTTAGGGIQAATWTVRVLTGLQLELQKQGMNFADSIAMISSVSGGAMGSLFFLDEYGDKTDTALPGFQAKDDADFSQLNRRPSTPFLDDVAWALVYRDIPRILSPFPSTSQGALLDRGRMMELSWQRQGRLRGLLSDWQTGVVEGWRPATIFNATLAETGEPFLFSTTSVDPVGPSVAAGSYRRPQRANFSDFYLNSDIELVTAARLASGFPYVLPTARAVGTDLKHKYHIIDGGYYDNYGVATAVQWVDRALRGLHENQKPLPPAVLVLQIRSFPDKKLPDLNKNAASYESASLPYDRTWFFQISSPLIGLLNVKTTAQLLRDRDELLLLRDRWGDGPDGWPRIRFASFEFPAKGAPLSFKMNSAQERSIDKVWQGVSETNANDITQIKCMFDPVFDLSKEKGCETLARSKEPW
jgi:Patatin-like phospholipase